MNIVFITAGPIEWASSRMRGYWVAEELRDRGHDVMVYQFAARRRIWSEADDADAYIWQKLVDTEMVDELPGLHFWDVCDPSWWWQPKECGEITRRAVTVVASSAALAADLECWDPAAACTHIPDCINFDHFEVFTAPHDYTDPVRLIWYGVAVNRVALWSVKAPLERLVANRHRIELTIMDDRPDVRFQLSDAFPIYHTQWSLQKEVEIISGHDIAVLPPYPGPWGRVKSNNKWLTAAACGLPAVGDSYEDLLKLVTDPRTREVRRNIWLEQAPDITDAGDHWERLLGVRA